jgi:hypothetical protein
MQNGVIRGRTPNKDIKKGIDDTKGLLKDRTPKKDMQEELEDKMSNQGPYTEEGHTIIY